MPLAMVTGGSRGIGRSIAIRLAADGFDLIITYRSRVDDANEVAAEIRGKGREARIIELDVSAGSDAESKVAAVVDSAGCPDVLVNNAGMVRDTLFATMGRESWEKVLNTNLGSFYSVTRPVLRQMLRRRSGRIISIASTAGLRGNAGQVNYSASKAGLIGATKALALEVAARNILVNAVAPGFIETEMLAGVSQQNVEEKILPLIPLKRAGKPEEVAAVVAFLASDGAAYITGEVINVNGGLYT
ncbi:MAG: 3-oxoacyl-ACP reductase [Deltaproteobacteria bacterium RIFOXYA12_FULL_58_15]|nr:MAG: 3-oxoacyl-ACP reductase [Deltaproteobacteria bacterium RIFOXYA12_FULL_58_15]OGR11114.1 MAG: 3-oxoacyl-ACP reductase [Deltaproteobacteria bacterium RIFOXYB12_FULL_58_9]